VAHFAKLSPKYLMNYVRRSHVADWTIKFRSVLIKVQSEEW